jgi:hypothetical protein
MLRKSTGRANNWFLMLTVIKVMNVSFQLTFFMYDIARKLSNADLLEFSVLKNMNLIRGQYACKMVGGIASFVSQYLKIR